MDDSIPECVRIGDEHPRMADGENVHFVSDNFVDDPIGTAEGLAEIVGVRRDRVEAFKRNVVTGLGMILHL